MNAPLSAPLAGRTCPLDYRYEPAVFAQGDPLRGSALYVAGGLYGNLPALRAADAMAAAEPGAVLVLNGDVHWFDATPAWFAAVEDAASRHLAIRGNVETEISRGVSAETGCGCAYPDSVDEATVERSNAVAATLSAVAAQVPGARARLAGLPMHRVADIGGARVAIVHGDAESLAGWRFDRTRLDDPRERIWLERVRRESRIDVFASTHTCSPTLRHLRLAAGEMVVANNGAAGMPNARGTRFGILTRVAPTPSPTAPLYGVEVAGLYVEALPLTYDHGAFLAAFDACWASGSPAAVSYRERIVAGPCGSLDGAAPGRARA